MDKPPKIVDDLLEALKVPGYRDDLRRVHAIGVGASGTFVPSKVARNYCVAKHFSSDRAIKVTVRFSNGSGSAEQHDGWSDVRGMATRFHIDDETKTDLVAMTLPEFFAPTPETFLDFLKKAKHEPAKVLSAWRKLLDLLQLKQPLPNPYRGQKTTPMPGAIRYADRNPGSQFAVMQAANIGAPVSYARAGVRNTDDKLKLEPVDRYLRQELRDRLARGPARFTLMMMVGEPGDDPNDSTRPWPPHRLRVVMGELNLKELIEDEVTEKLSFNPWLLVKGIEPSNDPVLQARHVAYQEASRRRGGVECPFPRSLTHGQP